MSLDVMLNLYYAYASCIVVWEKERAPRRERTDSKWKKTRSEITRDGHSLPSQGPLTEEPLRGGALEADVKLLLLPRMRE
ncbi:hypothetical protein EYF80_019865 [Liparis tanakae]|uniref:Uncharacterized protein n=1 Tax=Liparis tanakae TaxID=230148 RepID=A0A4Z2HYH7_9TELE|nr:hypothetical protein EYF80_019865 [Liparis tanakae]